MTMKRSETRIVKYLEDRGFGVSKKYDSLRQVFKFAIAKDNHTLTKEFVYPDWLNDAAKNTYMEKWLDSFIDAFEKSKYCKNDIKSDVINKMQNLLRDLSYSSKQKLFGDISTGYAYFGNGKGVTITKQISDYIAEGLINEIKKGEENMDTSDNTYHNYCQNDIVLTNNMMCIYSTYKNNGVYDPIEKVIFNDPATIVFWKDGTKTIVKAVNEVYDPEKGFAMAITKKFYGNEGNYYNHIKKWVGDNRKCFNDEHNHVYDESAYLVLVNVLTNKKARKCDLTDAIEEAIGYLRENLED